MACLVFSFAEVWREMKPSGDVLFFSFLGDHKQASRGVVWTSFVYDVKSLCKASRDELETFCLVNLTSEDYQQLSVSSLSRTELRRIAAAVAVPPGEVTQELCACLTPYASCSVEEMYHIARKRNALPPCAMTRQQLLRWLIGRTMQQHPLSLSLEGERIRRETTIRCLDAIKKAFEDARFEEETKRFLDWTKRDAPSHTDPTMLLGRLKWLRQHIDVACGTRIVNYLKSSIIPFLQWRKDLILSDHGCAEALKVDKKLRRPCVAPEASLKRLNGYFQLMKWKNDNDGKLREPQRLALDALFQTDPGAGIVVEGQPFADVEYECLLRLRSWFSRVLNATYAGVEPPLEDGESIFESLLQVKAKVSPLPRMIVLPTGVGKSGVMCLAPFTLSKKPGRVLVVCPNVVIVDVMVTCFSSFFHQRLNLDDVPSVLLVAEPLNAELYSNHDVFVVTFQRLVGKISC
jgi:hypothetical protein